MECCQVIMTICQHIIIMLRTILVSTTDFVSTRPRKNILGLLPYPLEKSENDRVAFLYQRDQLGKKQGNCFDKDWAAKKISCEKQLKQQINPTREVVPGNCVEVILRLYSSVLIIWSRNQSVSFPIQFITILTQLLASLKAGLP